MKALLLVLAIAPILTVAANDINGGDECEGLSAYDFDSTVEVRGD